MIRCCRPAQETKHKLQMARRDLAAQMQANAILADQWISSSPTSATPLSKGEVQQSVLSELRSLAESIEQEVLKGMEAEMKLQLLSTNSA